MTLDAHLAHGIALPKSNWHCEPRLEAVVFDLDDTLYPERQFVESGYRAVAKWIDSQGVAREQELFDYLIEQSTGAERGHTFDRLVEFLGAPGGITVVRLVDIYRQHLPHIHPRPGIRQLLAELRPLCRIGLISDGYLDVQRRKLDALQLAPCLDAIVFSDQWGSDAWKPAPRPFREALQRLRVRPERAIYVADNPRKDFLGARRSGMRSLRFRCSEGLYARDEPQDARYAPDAEVNSVGQLRRWLLGRLEPVSP